MSELGPAFPRLVQEVLEGSATTAQRGQLEDCLRRDPALRAEYVWQFRLAAPDLPQWMYGIAARPL